MIEKELEHLDQWKGAYRGVRFKIVHWGVGASYRPEGTWNYYLHIPLDMIPEEKHCEFLAKPEKDEKGRIHYRYTDLELLCNLEWHCGITYYDKLGIDGNPTVIEAGCDYAHYWDEGKNYQLNEILHDCQNTIDALWSVIPDMRRHCFTVGGYYKLSEGVLNRDNFISFAGIRWHRENYPDSDIYKDVVIPEVIEDKAVTDG